MINIKFIMNVGCIHFMIGYYRRMIIIFKKPLHRVYRDSAFMKGDKI